MTFKRVLYVAAGPADLISAHGHWRDGTHEPTEVSVTFSGQIQDFCVDLGAEAYMVSVHRDGRKLRDGGFVIEHRPKRPWRGPWFHLAEIVYGIGLLRTALRWRADLAILDSGATHFFAMWLFKLAGVPVVPVLHNTLWPAGFRPRSRVGRVIGKLDSMFFRRGPRAVIGVSPECTRQLDELAPRRDYPTLEVRAQFMPDFFSRIDPPPPHDERPFRVMFIGRIERLKGVLDIPGMARRIEERAPGLVEWEICGRGMHFDELVAAVRDNGVGHVVHVRGWTSLEELRRVYGRSHAAIVPTRSLFAEGLAMTAAEAILARRPLVTNPVVPALELLRPACMEARTDDPDSHADAVLTLARDRALYERLQGACGALAEPFYDRRWGLRQVLHDALRTGHRTAG